MELVDLFIKTRLHENETKAFTTRQIVDSHLFCIYFMADLELESTSVSLGLCLILVARRVQLLPWHSLFSQPIQNLDHPQLLPLTAGAVEDP